MEQIYEIYAQVTRWLLSLVIIIIWLYYTLSEAGLFAIRDDRDYVIEEDFMKGARKIAEVKKLESKLDYSKV